MKPALSRRDLVKGIAGAAAALTAGCQSEAPAPEEAASEWETDARIDALLADRQAARGAKDWAGADRIRDELADEGIEIVDTETGPRWRRKEPA